MKLHLLTVPILALLMSACSLEREATTPDTQGRAIAFGTSEDAATRALTTTQLRKIGVFGYAHTGNFGTGASLRPDYFFNKPVVDIAGNGTWSYDGVYKYWPMDGRNVSFFAYAPYVYAPFADDTDIFTLYPNQDPGHDTGAPKINYTVPGNMIEQIDIVWCRLPDMTYAKTIATGGKVAFDMKHALTAIDFEVKLDVQEKGNPQLITFTSLEMRGVIGSGTLDMSTGTWDTTPPVNNADRDSYTTIPGKREGLAALTLDARNVAPATGDADPWNGNKLFVDGHRLMLIPQELTDAEVVLKFTVTNTYTGAVEEREQTLSLVGGALPDWEVGKAVTYQITASCREGQIRVQISGLTIDSWIDYNSDDPMTGILS